MTTFQIGRRAEARAIEFLNGRDFRVLNQNWRTRYCEIDIIALKDKTVYFVEVKYRSRANNGRGIDYITPKKLTQMNFAASIWVSNKRWEGDYRLSVIEVSGPEFRITNFLDEL